MLSAPSCPLETQPLLLYTHPCFSLRLKIRQTPAICPCVCVCVCVCVGVWWCRGGGWRGRRALLCVSVCGVCARVSGAYMRVLCGCTCVFVLGCLCVCVGRRAPLTVCVCVC